MQQLRKQLSESESAKRDAEQRSQTLQRERDAAQREREAALRERDRVKQERDTLARFAKLHLQNLPQDPTVYLSSTLHYILTCTHTHVVHVAVRR